MSDWWELLRCGRCGDKLTGYPAMSRVDNKTAICSQCGEDEALHDWETRNQKDAKLPPLGQPVRLTWLRVDGT